jgi:DNA-binding transcriptional MocR family regulator
MNSPDEFQPRVQTHGPVQSSEPVCPATLDSIHLDRSSRDSLVVQIVRAVERLIDSGALKPGQKMPSVRAIARQLHVSTFTVVEANERLMAAGRLQSRRGSGYFITHAEAAHTKHATARAAPARITGALAQDLYNGNTGKLPACAGWLPANWHGDGWIQDATRQAIRVHSDRLQGYGDAMGLPDMRRLLAQKLRQTLLDVDEQSVLLTRSATHAFDIILRTLCRPGDRVLVEDPGHPTLRSLIELHGCVPIAIPRSAEGLDLDVLEQLASQQTPKAFFVNTVAQNPLGTTLPAFQLHRLLGLADRFDFWLVEDDAFRELQPQAQPSLAAMDGLRRVVRVDSTSKTLSPFVRVGSICASGTLIGDFTRVKMVSGLTTSELDERVACFAMGSSDYRRMVSRLQARLENACTAGIEHLREMGLQPLARPACGMFVSARWTGATGAAAPSGRAIAELASDRGIVLAPAELFSSTSGDAPWFRFNVAHLAHPALHQFFADLKSLLN